jgi:hypothetical protein
LLAGIVPLLLAPSALAGQPIDPSTLNPVPPSLYTCMAVGSGAICHGDQVVIAPAAPTDVSCGSGPSFFQIFDQGTVYQHATRYYDRDLNLVRRVNHERWVDAAWSNPLTGEYVPYTQSDTITTVLTTPGDFGSATETSVGENIYRAGQGGQPILFSVGRLSIDDASGEVLFSSGKQWVVEFFFENNPAVLDEVCAALS